jgi:hypothetical protein
MTRAAESRLMEKTRRGEIVTPADHVTTIDDVEELEAFRKALIANGRMTEDAQIAIYRRQKQIGG